MLESTEKGGVRNSIRNCLTVFQNDPLLSGAIAKNLLTERTDIIKPIGYHRMPFCFMVRGQLHQAEVREIMTIHVD